MHKPARALSKGNALRSNKSLMTVNIRGRRTIARILAWILMLPSGLLQTTTAMTPTASAVLPVTVRTSIQAPRGADTASRIQTTFTAQPQQAIPPAAPSTPCNNPDANAIVRENCRLDGVAFPSQWDLDPNGAGGLAGDPSIQGFTTEFSVNKGATVNFKIDTDATSYHLDIYRLGYYNGAGARLVTTIGPAVALPQNQPACLDDTTTGLIDCGNWGVSAIWSMPSDAVSGIYVAKVTRDDTGGASHIFFVVRDDSSTSDVVVQTSDTTWQAYNNYGGNSLYTGSPAGRAFKVSYNRPMIARANQDGGYQGFLFNSEYPMVRWLEANGYDVSYVSGMDGDRFADADTDALPETINPISPQRHKVFMSVGHDEYWSARQRANVEAARDAGMHVAFFSGNEIFWKTRWEPSIDGSGTLYRTLVSYKETHANAKIDPLQTEWTGTWRDQRDFNPERVDGGTGTSKPENALSGTIFMVNGVRNDAIMVPAAFGSHRFWRNTSIASLQPGEVAILPVGTLGYEWDEAPDDAFTPPGLQRLSLTTIDVTPLYLQDNGSNYGAGTATHSLTLYRHASGALVFGAGTTQWSWGLDSHHDGAERSTDPPSHDMQQATINLLADMGVSAGSLADSTLIQTTSSQDTTAPTSSILSPPSGAALESGVPVQINGEATDVDGRLASVEVSVDGGTTWYRASGTDQWTYTWTPFGDGPSSIQSRAVDDSGNVQFPATSIAVTISRTCPCSIWSDAFAPTVAVHDDPTAVELGVRFKTDVDGVITGIRFYKGSSLNGGTHTGTLWASDGTPLSSATFASETTSGWQQVFFNSPVPVTAGTTYVASYFAPEGHYSLDRMVDAELTAPGLENAVDHAPLHALADGDGGGNGLFHLDTTGNDPTFGPGFPNATYQSSNYWVDVLFIPSSGPSFFVTSRAPLNGATEVSPYTTVTATLSSAVNPASLGADVFQLTGPGGPVPATVTIGAAPNTIVLTPAARLQDGAFYTATIRGGPTGLADTSSTPMTLQQDAVWSFTVSRPVVCPCSIWPESTVPSFLVNNAEDTNAAQSGIELGVKFRSDSEGFITGVRFYKSANNVGDHTGTLWDANGHALAEGTFTFETPSGWQQLTFDRPVAISANQTYIASYHTNVGRYSVNRSYFVPQSTAAFTRAPLRAMVGGEDGANGVYLYGGHAFPTNSYLQSNYWVDVVFAPSLGTDGAPYVVSQTPAPGAVGVPRESSIVVRFSEPVTIPSGALALQGPGGAAIASSLTYDSATNTATLSPSAVLAPSTTYTMTVHGGAAGVKDLFATTLIGDVTWTFTTAANIVCSHCTIWPETAAPSLDDVQLAGSGDARALNGIELGVRFRADIAGFISGIRFYKSVGNAGTHTGTLWDNNGTLLATATFSAETPSGWQEVTFSSPVPIQANHTYIASYHAPQGHYAVDHSYFETTNTTSFVRSPLRALVSVPGAPNGVFTYDGDPPFFAGTFGESNYWVDVVFSTSPTNSVPVAAADYYFVDEDQRLTVMAPGLLSNDTDAEESPLTAALATPPQHGALALAANGSFTYDALPNFNGTDTFTYVANDGTADSSPATVTITVNAVNDPPTVASPISNVTVNENAAAVVVSLASIFADVDGDTLVLTVSANTDAGLVSTSLSGTDLTLSFAPNRFGTASITVRADDGHGALAETTFGVTVNEVNRPPVAAADSYSTNEDTALTVAAPGVLGNDTDPDGDSLTASLVTGPAHGTFTLHADGSFSYLPAPNYNGADAFAYRVTDVEGHSDVGNVSLTILAVNDAPVTTADSKTTAEDTSLTFPATDLTINDTDADGDTLTVTAVTNGAKGSANLVSGSITYTPNLNANGSDSFTYTVSDGQGGTATGIVNVTITAVNDAPVTTADSKTTAEDTPLTFPATDLTVNDSDIDGDTLTVTAVTNGTKGTAVLSSGSITYTPNLNANGPDSFTYTVSDGHGGTATGIVNVTITAVNDAPVTTADSKTTAEDTSLTFPATDLTINDTDADGDTLTVTAVTNGAKGSASLVSGSITYTPNLNANGSDSFTYTVSDGHGGTATGTVNVTITAVNDAPVTTADSKTTAEDTPLTFPATDLTTNDTDVDGDTLTVTAVTNGTKGTANLVSGSITYSPNLNANGSDSFTYTVSDGQGGTATGTVTVTITAVNDAPIATADAYTTNEDTALNVSAPGVLVNDSDVETASSSLTAALVSGPAHAASFTLNANGSFNYTPAANYNGSDSFTYKANDGSVDSNVVTVSLTITPVNDPPVAVNDSATVTEDIATVIDVRANDADPDNATPPLNTGLTVTAVTQAAHGSVTIVNSGAAVNYAPSANYSGADSFTYTISDGSLTSTATVNVTVTAVNDAPVAVNDSASLAQGTNATIDVRANDTDPDNLTAPFNAGLTVTAVTQPGHGTATIAGPGTVTYTPTASYSGSDSFTYTIGDGSLTSTATVNVTVTPRTATTTTTPTSTLNPSTYGQSVTFTATVTGSGGTPTGTLSFYDTGTLLGSSTLSGGSAALTTSAVAAGTRSITAVYSGDATFASSTSAALTQTVNKVTLTTTLTVSPLSQQYSDQASMQATLSAPGAAESVTFKIGTIALGTATFDATGKASLSPQLLGAIGIGAKMVTAQLNNVNPNYTASNPMKPLTLLREDAAPFAYTGASTLRLSGGKATMTVQVADIADGNPGDVSNMTVAFINRGTGATLGTATVTPTGDGTTGTATLTWTATAGSYTIGFSAGNYYVRNNTADNVAITITN